MNKQIEEKKEIEKELNKVYPNARFTNGWLAEVLYKLGYRKIAEDSVVLTREEYKGLKLFVEKYPEVIKETAEKFAERVKEETDHGQSAIWDSTVDEICKEITEGKV